MHYHNATYKAIIRQHFYKESNELRTNQSFLQLRCFLHIFPRNAAVSVISLVCYFLDVRIKRSIAFSVCSC
jgi:hypothetical protein